MDNVSKILTATGILLIVCGFIWHFSGGKIPLGRLPGDIRIESENAKFYFPITTCLIISGLFTLITWIIRHFK